MVEGENPGFTAEETVAWAEMSGQPAPAPAEPADLDDEDLELDEVEEEAPAEQKPGEKRPDRLVKHGALHAERERRKAVEAEAQKLREFKAVMEDRFATMQRLAAAQAEQQQAPAQVDEDPEPDPNQDIFAHQAWLARQLKAERETRMKTEAEIRQREELAAAEQQVWSRWEQDRATFATENESFPDAAKFLAGLRDRQLEAYGIDDKRQRDQMINRELRDVVVQAARGGRNSADVIYRLAMAAGFNPESAKSAAAQVAQVAPPAPDKLAQVTKAKGASISLSQAGGKSAPPQMTAEDLVSMPQDEFNAWCEKNPKLWKQIAGG
jgi:hypothetical protein